jgi:hypothetical protein
MVGKNVILEVTGLRFIARRLGSDSGTHWRSQKEAFRFLCPFSGSLDRDRDHI